jgi:hypothetical protein
MLLNSLSLLAAQSTATDTARTVVDTAQAAVETAAQADTANANFLKLLDDYSGGIGVLFLSLAAVVGLIQWLSWIFLKGRFKPRTGTGTGTGDGSQSIRFVFTDLLVKIINDFRHLLALLMVIIFAATLGFMLFRAGTNMTDMADALQVVVATLGGLLGSILGYYFGESAVRKARGEDEGGEGQAPPEQGGPPSKKNGKPKKGEGESDEDEEKPRPAPPPKKN